MTDREVNIPLLRKAVEWAEAEAAKPNGLWLQKWWVSPADTSDSYLMALRQAHGLTEDCGTAYCIAGYVCHVEGIETGQHAEEAARLLGIDPGKSSAAFIPLFAAGNTIEDVRRIAEDIAGERL